MNSAKEQARQRIIKIEKLYRKVFNHDYGFGLPEAELVPSITPSKRRKWAEFWWLPEYEHRVKYESYDIALGGERENKIQGFMMVRDEIADIMENELKRLLLLNIIKQTEEEMRQQILDIAQNRMQLILDVL